MDDEEERDLCLYCLEEPDCCCCYDEDEEEEEEERPMNYPGSEDYFGPKLVNHGGKCCGIKIIYGFHSATSSLCEELPAAPGVNESDSYGRDVSSNERFFTDSAPRETFEERADRYIEFVKRRRPRHVIEVVFEEGQLDYHGWRPWLRKHRFRKVTKFLNSNSGNYVTIYHKAIGQPKKAKPKADPFSAGE
jgi:hypothetical protein